jgi:hypothetical protein
VVPTLRAEVSALPSLSTGKPSLVQITAASAPGRVWAAFLTLSSIDTVARPFLSWPVTTRRMLRLIIPSLGKSWAKIIAETDRIATGPRLPMPVKSA